MGYNQLCSEKHPTAAPTRDPVILGPLSKGQHCPSLNATSSWKPLSPYLPPNRWGQGPTPLPGISHQNGGAWCMCIRGRLGQRLLQPTQVSQDLITKRLEYENSREGNPGLGQTQLHFPSPPYLVSGWGDRAPLHPPRPLSAGRAGGRGDSHCGLHSSPGALVAGINTYKQVCLRLQACIV